MVGVVRTGSNFVRRSERRRAGPVRQVQHGDRAFEDRGAGGAARDHDLGSVTGEGDRAVSGVSVARSTRQRGLDQLNLGAVLRCTEFPLDLEDRPEVEHDDPSSLDRELQRVGPKV